MADLSRAEPVTVAIVIPVYNKRHHVEEGIGSVLRAVRHDPAVELRIVDNGSTDGTLVWLREVAPQGTLLESDARTIAGVRNFGARQSRAPLLAFLDSDVLVAPDFVNRLRLVFRDQTLDASGCECGLPPQPSWVERVWYNLTVRRGDGPRHYINSANFSVRRQAFDAIGGFPEDFETAEDYEICRRLVANGRSLRQSQCLEVAHLDNPKTIMQFVRKSYWHGLGAVRASRRGTMNLPTVSALAQLMLLVIAVAALLAGGVAPRASLVRAALALPWIAPLLLYCYRTILARRFVDPVRALLLCQAFLSARAAALAKVGLTHAINGRKRVES